MPGSPTITAESRAAEHDQRTIAIKIHEKCERNPRCKSMFMYLKQESILDGWFALKTFLWLIQLPCPYRRTTSSPKATLHHTEKNRKVWKR
jgi:hypothetical protein